MSKSVFQPEWRTQSRRKRRFYARYMGWLERIGFVIVTLLIAAFAGSFFYEVDEWVSADEVAIEAEETPVALPSDAHNVAILASHGQTVMKGDVLAEFAPPDAPLRSVKVLAPATGEFVIASEAELAAAKTPLLRIRNYDRLVLRPKLGGKSIANAKVGQRAEVASVRIQAEGGTLFRTDLGGSPAVSRSLAGDAVKNALDKALKGRRIAAREDIPLTIQGVDEIEIESRLRTEPVAGGGTAEFDPPPSFTLRGKVVEGEHVISAQLGDLPPDVRRAAVEALRRQIVGKEVDSNGRAIRIEDVLDPRFVVRLKASGTGGEGPPLPAASLKRTFDAVVELENVPAELVSRLRAAHRAGKAVTAKVQVRTGSRPIAYFLLRRS